MTRQTVSSDKIAPAVGPFSAAVMANGLLYSSGQIALDPVSGKLIEGGIVQQTEQVFRNLDAVLAAAGTSFADVVKTNVYLADIKEFPVMNGVYGEHFEAPYPARTTIQAAALPLGALVEIEVIAQ